MLKWIHENCLNVGIKSKDTQYYHNLYLSAQIVSLELQEHNAVQAKEQHDKGTDYKGDKYSFSSLLIFNC